jgi:ATP-dependent Clp protease ATP-binding subunit ClpX
VIPRCGSDKTILARTRQTGIGFGATLPKAKKSDESVETPAGGSSSSPGRPAEPKATLDDLDMEDLVSYGFIPEFVGRLPVIASLRALTQADLIRILCEPRNSLVKQYVWLRTLE